MAIKLSIPVKSRRKRRRNFEDPTTVPLEDYKLLLRGDTASIKGFIEWTPIQTAILKALDLNNPVSLVVVLSGSQVGKSTLVSFLLANAIDHGVSFAFHASKLDEAVELMEEKLLPFVYSNARISAKLRGKPLLSNTNMQPKIYFENGSGIIRSAQGAKNFRGYTRRLVVLDEVATYPRNIPDPIGLAIRRTSAVNTSGPVKTVAVSAPLGLSKAGAFWDYFNKGTKTRQFLTCSYCSKKFHWQIEQFIDGKLKCLNCGHSISEKNRQRMIREAEVISENPDAPYASFHLTQLDNPFTSLSSILQDFKSSEGNDQSLAAFRSDVMGEPMEQLDDSLILTDEHTEIMRKPLRSIEPKFVFGGADTHPNAFHALVVESDGRYDNIVKYRTIPRNSERDMESFDILMEFFEANKCVLSAVDVQGIQKTLQAHGESFNSTRENYLGIMKMLKNRENSTFLKLPKLIPVTSLRKSSFDTSPWYNKTVADWDNLWWVASDEAKVEIFGLLDRGLVRVSQIGEDVESRFYKEIRGEYLDVSGDRRKWVRTGANEALDAYVYAHAIRDFMVKTYTKHNATGTFEDFFKGK